jgi:predicted anti-sigma-YlaC factor YlaD
MTSHELTCQELVELVTDYLEGELSSADVARFDEHLSGCDGCRTYLQQMDLTIETLGKLTEEAIDPQMRDELLTLFRDWKAR